MDTCLVIIGCHWRQTIHWLCNRRYWKYLRRHYSSSWLQLRLWWRDGLLKSLATTIVLFLFFFQYLTVFFLPFHVSWLDFLLWSDCFCFLFNAYFFLCYIFLLKFIKDFYRHVGRLDFRKVLNAETIWLRSPIIVSFFSDNYFLAWVQNFVRFDLRLTTRWYKSKIFQIIYRFMTGLAREIASKIFVAADF